MFIKITIPTAGDIKVKVYDMAGKKVRDTHYDSGTYNSGVIKADVSGIAAGTYMLQLTESNGNVHNIKFTKQ